MHDPWIPGLLHRAAPDTRLMVMLRDPVERYQSGIAREQRLAGKRGQPVDASVWSDAFARGLYGMQVARLLDHYDGERILVLQYERCATDPLPELRRTYDFLGIEPDHEPTSLRDWVGRVNTKDELPSHVREELVAAYADDVAVAGAAVPGARSGALAELLRVAGRAGRLIAESRSPTAA